MKITISTFDQLSSTQLYELLRLRAEVFVVEQDCVYQDVDGKDGKALHILGYEGETLVAYARCFAPGDYFDEAAIGRIVVKEDYRGKGYGHQVVEAAEKAVVNQFSALSIKLSAQTHLEDFYKEHGYQGVGDTYLEDGIPHIAMLKSLQN